MITVLTGGTGGAKFVDGLRQIVPPEELTIIVNTGDDLLWWGLYVSPDLDSITYMLAGKLSPFLLEGALARLVHLAHGLAVILTVIAAKLVLHWAHGIWPAVPEVPTLAGLLLIVGVLAVVTLTSLRATRRPGRGLARSGGSGTYRSIAGS